MTSSLVGSEMCIRDSPYCLLHARAWPCRGALVWPRTVGRKRVGDRWRGSCLLYTSDAADDM
eukprot:12332952-Prorocentrum_lima.AAC.1